MHAIVRKPAIARRGRQMLQIGGQLNANDLLGLAKLDDGPVSLLVMMHRNQPVHAHCPEPLVDQGKAFCDKLMFFI